MRYKIKTKSKLEEFGVFAGSVLVENFPDTYFTGGTTRDWLLGKTPEDIDLATSALPEEVCAQLTKYYISFSSGFKNFGVIVATKDQLKSAIATFRKESYKNSRFPKIAFTRSLKEDAKRRDFTINSLYISCKTGELKDFFGGQKDLKKKIVRFIGKPKERIVQDPLRILRALRLTLFLNFKIEKNTFSAIKNNFDLLKKTVSQAKILSEINKLKKITQKNILQKILLEKNFLDKYFKVA